MKYISDDPSRIDKTSKTEIKRKLIEQNLVDSGVSAGV